MHVNLCIDDRVVFISTYIDVACLLLVHTYELLPGKYFRQMYSSALKLLQHVLSAKAHLHSGIIVTSILFLEMA
jgi:hypothetical protein